MFGKRKSKSPDSQHQSLEQLSSGEEKQKLSSKQKLMKLFLTSDLKNPKFWKPLRTAKAEMIRNLHDGGFDAEAVNKLFRIYFHDHKNIFIPNHLASLINRYKVFVPDMPNDRELLLREYLFILRYIRTQFEPTMKQIAPFKDFAREYAQKEMKKEQSEVYTGYDREQEQELYREFAKKKFAELMNLNLNDGSVVYDDARFRNQWKTISDTWNTDDYRHFIVFAILGMHYFKKESLVYSAFSKDQLQEYVILPLSSRGHDTISLTLEEFLHIIQHLDFKNNVFSF